jgi:3-oxoadipate enol-lactonase
LLSDLSGHYRVTVFDLPGVGYSGVATSRVTLAWLADMVAGFSLTVGLEDPVVLGWGLGGQIALSLVERHPGLASALVLVDTAAGGADADLPSRGVVRLLSEPAATPLTLSTVLFPPTVAGLAERLSWPDSLFEGPPDWMTAQSVEAEASLQATIWRTASLRAELARMTTPALVVCGADDVVFPPLNSSRLASEIPHATLVSFPGSGYGAIIEDEPEFVAALERFTLANVSPTTSTTTTSTSPSS